MLVRKIMIALLIAVLATNTLAESSVFVVSKGSKKIVLGGTIHLLRESDFPLPAEFDNAFENTEKVFFETDLVYASSPEFGQRFASEMSYKDGTTLDKVLTPELWARLQVYSAKRQFPIYQMKMYNPAFVSMVMTVFESQRLGITSGVETYFQAKLGDKPVGELENAEEVLASMHKMAALDGNALISSTLRDIENFDQFMDSAVKAWREGDMEKIYQELAQDMLKETPGVYQALLVDRNKMWLPKIEALFATKEVEFVLVGAMHLAGPEGLLNLLKNKGYKVRQYKVTNRKKVKSVARENTKS